jgi:hypothetical protein
MCAGAYPTIGVWPLLVQAAPGRNPGPREWRRGFDSLRTDLASLAQRLRAARSYRVVRGFESLGGVGVQIIPPGTS